MRRNHGGREGGATGLGSSSDAEPEGSRSFNSIWWVLLLGSSLRSVLSLNLLLHLPPRSSQGTASSNALFRHKSPSRQLGCEEL